MLPHPFGRPGLWVCPEFRLDNDSDLPTVCAMGVKNDLTTAEREAWRTAVEAIDND